MPKGITTAAWLMLLLFTAVTVRAVYDGDYTGVTVMIPVAILVCGYFFGGAALKEIRSAKQEQTKDRNNGT